MIRPRNSPSQSGPLTLVSEKRARKCSPKNFDKRETASKVFIVNQKYFLLRGELIFGLVFHER